MDHVADSSWSIIGDRDKCAVAWDYRVCYSGLLENSAWLCPLDLVAARNRFYCCIDGLED